MSDTFTLTAEVDLTQARRDVDSFATTDRTLTFKATPQVDQSALDNIGQDLPAVDLPVELGDVDTSGAVDAIGEIGGAAEEQTGKVGFLRGALGDLGLTSLGLGAAFQIVTGAISVLTGWFDSLGIKAETTAAGSQAAADSVFGLFDALTTLQDATFDTTSGLGALNEAFRSGIDAANAGDIDKVSESFTRLGLNFEDLSATMLDFQTNEAAAVSGLAVGAGATQAFADALGEAATHGDSVNDSFRSLSEDGMRAFAESVGLTGHDVDAYVDKLGEMRDQNALNVDQFVNQLPEGLRATGQALVDAAGDIETIDDAAENTADTLGHLIEELQKSPEGAAALASVREALPNASDAELLQALVDKLAAIPDAADPAATALDDVSVDRDATITATADADAAEEVLQDAADDRDAQITAEADTRAASGDIDAVADADHPTTIAADADTTAAASELLDTASEPRTALIVAVANNMGANAALESLTDATRTAVITALAHTAVAERELNDTARNRTSTITVRTVGGGAAAASSGARTGAAVAATSGELGRAAVDAAPVAATSFGTSFAPTVVINTAVIGDRYDVQRVVTRAVRGAARIGGSRN